MGLWSIKNSGSGSPGIDGDSVPTINVAGHEVQLPAYWRIVALSDSGRSPSEIVEQVTKMTNVPHNARWLIMLVVDSIVENLHLIQSTGFNPDGMRRISRASIIANHNKPMRFSTFRPSKLSAKPETSGSWEQLHAAQQKEAEAVTEALKLLSQKETVRTQIPLSVAKRMTGAAIDEDVRAALRKHEAVEAEAHRAKKLVKKNRMTIL